MNNKSQHIRIGGVETTSFVDFPGKISAAIFMQGCPWRCPFCYNESLQKADSDHDFLWDKFIEFLKTRQGKLDAVTFSGGEPLMQNSLQEAIKEVKDLGFAIGLHTGGYRPDMLAKVLPLVDWIGFDIKAPFEENKYAKAIGINADSISNVLKSLRLVIASGKDFECRTTCDPRILNIQDIYTIADSLKKMGVKKYHLQKYRPVPADKTTQDAECEEFVTNQDLIKYLKENFTSSEMRK